jgi:hypothetical protein
MSTPFWWWNLTRQQKARRLAWSLVIPPVIMLFPFTLAAFADPWVIVEAWDIYLIFYGLPFAVAAACWIYARRLSQTSRGHAHGASKLSRHPGESRDLVETRRDLLS